MSYWKQDLATRAGAVLPKPGGHSGRWLRGAALPGRCCGDAPCVSCCSPCCKGSNPVPAQYSWRGVPALLFFNTAIWCSQYRLRRVGVRVGKDARQIIPAQRWITVTRPHYKCTLLSGIGTNSLGLNPQPREWLLYPFDRLKPTFLSQLWFQYWLIKSYSRVWKKLLLIFHQATCISSTEYLSYRWWTDRKFGKYLSNVASVELKHDRPVGACWHTQICYTSVHCLSIA